MDQNKVLPIASDGVCFLIELLFVDHLKQLIVNRLAELFKLILTSNSSPKSGTSENVTYNGHI